MRDTLTAAADGLTGFDGVMKAAFPKTDVQSRIVHNSVKYISWKDRKATEDGLKEMYPATSEDAARAAPERFAETRYGKHPDVSKSWRIRQNEIIPFMKLSPEIRTAVYTTNAIESLNHTLQRKRENLPILPQ